MRVREDGNESEMPVPRARDGSGCDRSGRGCSEELLSYCRRRRVSGREEERKRVSHWGWTSLTTSPFMKDA